MFQAIFNFACPHIYMYTRYRFFRSIKFTDCIVFRLFVCLPGITSLTYSADEMFCFNLFTCIRIRFAGHLLLCSSTSLFDPMLTWWSKKVLIGQTCDLSKNKEKLMNLARSLSNDDSDGNDNENKNVKTTKGFLAKQKVCTCITLFLYISLPLLHD